MSGLRKGLNEAHSVRVHSQTVQKPTKKKETTLQETTKEFSDAEQRVQPKGRTLTEGRCTPRPEKDSKNRAGSMRWRRPMQLRSKNKLGKERDRTPCGGRQSNSFLHCIEGGTGMAARSQGGTLLDSACIKASGEVRVFRGEDSVEFLLGWNKEGGNEGRNLRQSKKERWSETGEVKVPEELLLQQRMLKKETVGLQWRSAGPSETWHRIAEWGKRGGTEP